jgi:hypothetical protein
MAVLDAAATAENALLVFITMRVPPEAKEGLKSLTLPSAAGLTTSLLSPWSTLTARCSP